MSKKCDEQCGACDRAAAGLACVKEESDENQQKRRIEMHTCTYICGTCGAMKTIHGHIDGTFDEKDYDNIRPCTHEGNNGSKLLFGGPFSPFFGVMRTIRGKKDEPIYCVGEKNIYFGIDQSQY